MFHKAAKKITGVLSLDNFLSRISPKGYVDVGQQGRCIEAWICDSNVSIGAALLQELEQRKASLPAAQYAAAKAQLDEFQQRMLADPYCNKC